MEKNYNRKCREQVTPPEDAQGEIECVSIPLPHQKARGHFVRLTILAGVLLLCFGLVIGCAPKAVDTQGTDSSETDNEAVGDTSSIDMANFKWSAASDCSVCHTKETETTGDSPCPVDGSGSDACMTCHTEDATLGSVHEGVVSAENVKSSRLKATSISESLCLGCHESYEQLAIKTANNTTLTDDNGLCINPHAIPTTGNHGDVTCTSCHVVHGKSNAARRVCVGCHHQTIWECNTCHDYTYE